MSETSDLGTWRGRPSKSYQDRQPSASRDRVKAAQHRLDWMQKHKPATSADWEKYRRG